MPARYDPEIIELPDAQLLLWRDFVPAGEGQELLALWRDTLAWQQSRIRFGRVERPIPRLNAWYGAGSYRYSGIEFPPRSFPAELEHLRQRIAEQSGYRFNAALVNLYRDGRDSVAWHADDEPELGLNPVIGSFSLGCTRIFRLRHNASRKTFNLPLESGMLLVMAGPMQHHWQHCIPKEPAVPGERLNVTFRQVESRRSTTPGRAQ